MLVKYTLKFTSGKLWNENGTSAWFSPEGEEIRQQIDQLVEQFGLIRESPHRSPETIDLTAAINFLSACNSLSTPTITVEAKIVCPAEFCEETLREYRLQALSSVTINILDEKGNSPGFVWCGCQWAWQDFENKRTGLASSKNEAIALLIESLKSSSFDVSFSPEIQDILAEEADITDFHL